MSRTVLMNMRTFVILFNMIETLLKIPHIGKKLRKIHYVR